jgi:hypothetical protein
MFSGPDPATSRMCRSTDRTTFQKKTSTSLSRGTWVAVSRAVQYRTGIPALAIRRHSRVVGLRRMI